MIAATAFQFAGKSSIPSLVGFQPGLGRADPACAQSCAMCQKHQVLRRKRAVDVRPAFFPNGADQDERRGVVENLEIRVVQHFCEVGVGCNRERTSLHQRLCLDPQALQQIGVAYNAKRPGLKIDCAWRLDHSVDQRFQLCPIHRLGVYARVARRP